MARPSGPRALLEAIAAESRIAAIVLEMIDAFLGRARDDVLTGGEFTPPDMAQWPGDEVWEPLVMRDLLPALGGLYTRRWSAMEVLADPEGWLAAYLDTVPSRLSAFPAQAFDFVRSVLADGINAGESIPRLRDRVGAALQLDAPSRVMIDKIARLTDVIDDPASTPEQRERARAARTKAHAGLDEADRTWHWRAERIARTETTGALNAASAQSLQAQYALTGYRFELQWWATRHPPSSADSAARTRPTHRQAHRQTIGPGGRFSVGGASLAYPGDPTGPAEEVINCRCSVISVG